MYKFSTYNFSDKEINQIVELVHLWSTGSMLAVDRRKHTKQVINYATRWNLIIKGCDIVEWDYKTETRGMPYWAKANRYYPKMRSFNPVWDLPQEVLWRLVEPMIKFDHIGFSITKNKGWQVFGIWQNGTKQFKEDDCWIDQMRDILNKLASWSYIIFQYAGSVWQITLTPEKAIRTEL